MKTIDEDLTSLSTKHIDSVILKVETFLSVKELKCKTLNMLKEKKSIFRD